MLYLYKRGFGSSEIELVRQIPDSDWLPRKATACRLLRARGTQDAAALLESIPFEFWQATNSFGDQFWVLYYRTTVAEYAEIEESPALYDEYAWRQAVRALSEVAHEVRFVVVVIDEEAEALIPMTSLDYSSNAVDHALADAEQLIQTRGGLSALDRSHTVFHGYVQKACEAAGIAPPPNASTTALFKELRQNHPRLKARGPNAVETDRIARSLAAIVDALDSVRNKSSLAHPNAELLEEPEARLAINAIRTLLQYLSRRVGT